jgi:hypothetical protein
MLLASQHGSTRFLFNCPSVNGVLNALQEADTRSSCRPIKAFAVAEQPWSGAASEGLPRRLRLRRPAWRRPQPDQRVRHPSLPRKPPPNVLLIGPARIQHRATSEVSTTDHRSAARITGARSGVVDLDAHLHDAVRCGSDLGRRRRSGALFCAPDASTGCRFGALAGESTTRLRRPEPCRRAGGTGREESVLSGGLIGHVADVIRCASFAAGPRSGPICRHRRRP